MDGTTVQRVRFGIGSLRGGFLYVDQQVTIQTYCYRRRLLRNICNDFVSRKLTKDKETSASSARAILVSKICCQYLPGGLSS